MLPLRRRTARPLGWLAALLVAYLCAPLLAGIQQVGGADWHGVEWPTLTSALAISVGSATLAALLIALGGIPLGYCLARSRSRWVAALGFIVQLPLAMPPLTSGVLLLFLFGPYGLLGRFVDGAFTDSFAGIVCAQVFVAAPFLIIAARSSFSTIDPLLDDVAATLGHSAGRRFWYVSLPIAWPAIQAGLALAWLRAFGEFGATVMLAYHPYSLPVYTYVAFGARGLPAMLPLLLPTLVVAVAFAALAAYRRDSRASGRGVGEPMLPHSVDVDVEAGAVAEAFATTAATALSLHFTTTLGAFTLDIAWAPRARRLAIIGPSGSGKSLTLRLIAGLEAADTAQLSAAGSALAALPPERRQIAYVPQDYGLFPHMDVARQLAFPVGSDAGAARYWIDHLGLSGLTRRRPATLSLGQRQRVALARALARRSRIILLDEPFSALDTPRRRALRQSLLTLQRQISATTILVTHDPDDAALLADEILVLDQGRVLQAGPTATLFARPASLQVAGLLGVSNVGTGVLTASGWVDAGAGLLLRGALDAAVEVGGARANLPPGTAVMWRVSPDGIVPVPAPADERSHGRGADDLAYNPSREIVVAGMVDSIELHGGDRVALLRIGGVLLRCRAAAATLVVGLRQHYRIDPAAVSIWPQAASLPA